MRMNDGIVESTDLPGRFGAGVIGWITRKGQRDTRRSNLYNYLIAYDYGRI